MLILQDIFLETIIFFSQAAKGLLVASSVASQNYNKVILSV